MTPAVLHLIRCLAADLPGVAGLLNVFDEHTRRELLKLVRSINPKARILDQGTEQKGLEEVERDSILWHCRHTSGKVCGHRHTDQAKAERCAGKLGAGWSVHTLT